MPSERILKRIEKILDEIDAALDRGDWQTVRERAKDALAYDPVNVDAREHLEAAERRLAAGEKVVSETPPAPASPLAGVAAKTEPESFANSRYKVKKFLGEGGKKRVYLARDTVLDRDVAFALIMTDSLDEAARTRVMREAQVMGRLGDHPNIMPIFDLGREGDQPFMVLPLMPGGDVEGLLEKARQTAPPKHAGGGRGPAEIPALAIDRVIEIGVAVCKGLDFAHSHGIVHRDLKPGNVWLTADGTPKIGDFGLALPMEQTRLTQAGMMVGTVAYMPPEQALGGEITPRADLYALGCMLYEMVAGRPPFLGDDQVAIIGQHINTPPVAPSWHNPACPKPLEALIMRLLAKDPDQRPDCAADVRAALQAIDLLPSAASSASGLSQGEVESRSLDSLAGGVFVGRQKEVGELRAALEESLSGRGKLVMLVGEPGIGKTRTALELTTYAGLRRCQVLWGRCYEAQGAPPYWPWVQALRGYVREKDPSQLRAEMGSGAAEIAEIVSDIRERLPDLRTPQQIDSPDAARFRLFDAIAAFLRGASRTQPIVLILDDLHWADKPSLLLLQFVARELVGARLLVIGTYRDVELSRKHPLAETLGDLNRERLFARILLRGLSLNDIERFVELTSGTRAPAGLVKAVHEQTEGNPLFATEIVRLLVQEGQMQAAAGSVEKTSATTKREAVKKTTWTIRIPEGVREVIGRRLNRLSATCNDVLTTAAVIGREFSLQQILAVSRASVAESAQDASARVQSEARLIEVLEEALAARIIEEIPTAVARYQFTHALIQETLANELSIVSRSRLHARIAEALEELYGDHADSHAAELAYHYAAAEAILGSDKLIKYSLAAGDRALAAYAYEEALEHFRRALAARADAPMDRTGATLYFGLGRAQAATLEGPQLSEAIESLSKAFDFYVRSGQVDAALAVADHAMPHYAGYLAGEVELVERALAIAPPDSPAVGRLLPSFGRVLAASIGDHARADQVFAQASTIAESTGNAAFKFRTLGNQTFGLMFKCPAIETYREIVRVGTSALPFASQIDDPYAEIQARYGLHWAYQALGDLESARAQATALLEPAQKIRDRSWLSRCYWANERVRAVAGQWESAIEFNDQAVAISPMDPRPLYTRACLEGFRGNWEVVSDFIARLWRIAKSSPGSGNVEWAALALGIPVLVHTGWDPAKLPEATSVARRVIADKTSELFEVMGKAGLALGLVLAKDLDDLGALYEFLLRARGVYVQVGSLDRLLGICANALGRLEDAAAHYEDAVAFLRRAGYRPELAWALSEQADLLADSANSDDRVKIASSREESLRIANELGMKPLIGRIVGQKKILNA